jgi:putative two-component system response regulator
MSTKNILLVDDSNTNLVLLESLLTRKGYNVTASLSAKDGFDSMKETIPDLIYLDLIMPEVDGFQFIRQMKDTDKWKNIPVVILSAVSDDDVIKKCLDLGAVDYMTKPLDISKISNLTTRILDN